MNTILVDLTERQFKQKAFLNEVYDCPIALKFYLLADKTEILLLSSICYYMALKESYWCSVKRKTITFEHYVSLESYLSTIEAYYKRCYSLSVNKDKSHPYLKILKDTLINNWDYFNPNIKRIMYVKFNRTNLRKLQ